MKTSNQIVVEMYERREKIEKLFKKFNLQAQILDSYIDGVKIIELNGTRLSQINRVLKIAGIYCKYYNVFYNRLSADIKFKDTSYTQKDFLEEPLTTYVNISDEAIDKLPIFSVDMEEAEKKHLQKEIFQILGISF